MRQLALLASASPSGRSIIFKLPQEIYTTLAKTGAPARQVTRHSYMNGAPPVTLPVARIAHTDEWAVPSIRYRQPRFSRMKIMECGPATGATGSRPGLRYRRGPRERPQSLRRFLHYLERRADIPILRQAKAEYKKLTATASAVSLKVPARDARSLKCDFGRAEEVWRSRVLHLPGRSPRRIQLGRLLLVWRNISTASCVSPVDPFTSPRTTREAT